MDRLENTFQNYSYGVVHKPCAGAPVEGWKVWKLPPLLWKWGGGWATFLKYGKKIIQLLFIKSNKYQIVF